MKKTLVVVLIVLISCTAVFANGGEEIMPTKTSSTVATPKQADRTVVIGVPANFEEKWNPVLAESAYDQQVIEQIFTSPCRVNADNEMVPYAGNIAYKEESDGILYTVTCKKGMTFSDGEPVTIDDFIYGLYLWADPSYTGPSATFVQEDIEGLKEYYYNDPKYTTNAKEIAKIVADKYSLDTISEEDAMTYLIEGNLDGSWDGVPTNDPWGLSWIDYVNDYGPEGIASDLDLTVPDQCLEAVARVEYATCFDAYDPAAWWTAKFAKERASSEPVKTITGIKRIDDYTCTVKYNSVNIYGDRAINGYYIPEHYYGALVKGDVSKIQQNMVPLGSGPYEWKGYADNIVTCVANPTYFEGVPVIGTVKWQYVPENDTLSSLASGAIDIANPSGNRENLEEIESLGLGFDLTDTAGYGYCGFNADNMSLNVRKGLFCLMSNRTATVKGYYGEIADVIERPMPTVLAEYPKDAGQYYPYEKKVALDYFMKAGYSQVNGKLVNDKGEKLVVNAYIGGSGTGDHPTFAMLVQAAEDLKSLGGELQIQDVPFNVLQAAMNDGTADIFVLAWGNVVTCDKKSQFYTDGGQNRYNVSDSRMDALLDKIVVTVDLEERKQLVSDMLDLAMDLCMELPVYQRKNIIAYNEQNVNMKTVPANTTAFWDYTDALWKLELN